MIEDFLIFITQYCISACLSFMTHKAINGYVNNRVSGRELFGGFTLIVRCLELVYWTERSTPQITIATIGEIPMLKLFHACCLYPLSF